MHQDEHVLKQGSDTKWVQMQHPALTLGDELLAEDLGGLQHKVAYNLSPWYLSLMAV